MSQTFLVAILGILFYLSSLLGGHAPNSDWNGTNPPDTTFTSIGYVKDSPSDAAGRSRNGSNPAVGAGAGKLRGDSR